VSIFVVVVARGDTSPNRDRLTLDTFESILRSFPNKCWYETFVMEDEYRLQFEQACLELEVIFGRSKSTDFDEEWFLCAH
jgi:hypothetical protein